MALAGAFFVIAKSSQTFVSSSSSGTALQRECGQLSEFTRISYHRDWIDAVLYDAKFCTDKEGHSRSVSVTTTGVRRADMEWNQTVTALDYWNSNIHCPIKDYDVSQNIYNIEWCKNNKQYLCLNICFWLKLGNDQLTAEVRSVGGHQTHAVVAAASGEMTHCGPLVLLRVVDNHVSKVVTTIMATCRVSWVMIIMTQYCPALTGYHKPAVV